MIEFIRSLEPLEYFLFGAVFYGLWISTWAYWICRVPLSHPFLAPWGRWENFKFVGFVGMAVPVMWPFLLAALPFAALA